MLRIRNSDKIEFVINEGSNDWNDYKNIKSLTTVKQNHWHHVAGVVDRVSNEMKLFLDGELQTTENISNVSSINTQDLFTIGTRDEGANGNKSEYFKGQIDEIRIWEKALTESEIQDRMYRPIDQTDPLWSDLSGYYKMDWGQGNTAFDYSAKGNHGTLTNGPDWVEAYSWERGMVAHYPLDGSGRDIHGTHSGSLIGTTPTTNLHGYSQKALGLDGVDDYVEIEEAPEFDTNQHTVSFWVNLDNVSRSGNLVSKANIGTEQQWLLKSIPGGKVRSVILKSDNTEILKDHQNALSSGIWYHIVRTWDGNLMSLYINGVKDQEFPKDTTGNLLNSGSKNLYLGAATLNSNELFFDGGLDEFRFYDRELSQKEINSLFLYESNDRLNDDLLVYYPFNGDTNDYSGNNKHGYLSGAVLTTDRFGNLDHAYDFSRGDYVSSFSSSDINLKNSSFSISAWVKLDNLNGSDALVGQGGPGTNLGLHYSFRNNALRAGFYSNDLDVSWQRNLKWNHWTVTYDSSSRMRAIYMNGVKVKSSVATNNFQGEGTFYIGRNDCCGETFDGKIDDVRIYNKSLDEEDVNHLYDKERPHHSLDSINGLVLWLDAENVDGKNNTTLYDQAAIDQWKDLSGNGNDLIEHPGTDTPIYKKTGFNETKSTVYFDANDILHAADNYPHPFRMNRMTIYVVGNNN